MRTLWNYTIEKEDPIKMREAKRFNPALEITFRDKNGEYTHTINAGYADETHLFRDGFLTVLLSMNYGLDYCGLEAWDETECKREIFFDNPNETIGDLRKEWTDYAPINLAKIMMNYLPYD